MELPARAQRTVRRGKDPGRSGACQCREIGHRVPAALLFDDTLRHRGQRITASHR
jgi:hypothetical protein